MKITSNKIHPRKHEENQTRPYGLHASFLPLVGLPFAVPLPEKLERKRNAHISLVIPEDARISLVILKDTHISLVIPNDAPISLVISKDTHISLVIPKDAHISLVIPKDEHISLVIPKDAHISLVIPKDIHISKFAGQIERGWLGSGQLKVRVTTSDGFSGARWQWRFVDDARRSDDRLLRGETTSGGRSSPASPWLSRLWQIWRPVEVERGSGKGKLSYVGVARLTTFG
ncbi:NBS-LRR type resistance protein [Cucumis melo var. makuwa]|uniref:NBS-LRR type resistance protein n=1 Tax=Cucumis melo var. makuwa TaxID=1194695 RepID=A0A5D3DD83_CUCMM|nr:NBS-LRR type resistance protein [Cucumis melo var. makuwa]TYK21526.1 NBS-LRR type resistance protein [Cucumis melo var. makuwa]